MMTQYELEHGKHLTVGMLVHNTKFAGRGKAHEIQRVEKIDSKNCDAYVRRINTNGMLARVKCCSLKAIQ